ncbi:MAG TPA: WYL domain-containing protein [Vicinamibacteria bacterium]|nr:WYL domain-containing protein [Vicinamibacteria bacterium]
MPERRRRTGTTAERLGRMLVITPYLVQHPGTTVREICRIFDVEEKDLRRDLELLFMSGRPPYGPGDLIDVEVDADDAIWVSMADQFARPVRLTRQEALAVHLNATELLATPGMPEAPALRRAVEKLRTSLGDAPGIEAIEAGVAPPLLEDLRDAAAGRRRIRIDYVAASTGERGWRTIEPESVFASTGNWYVAAWDLDADGERLFRADRVVGIEATDVTFAARGLEGAGRPLYAPTEADVAIRLRLHPAARWVAEYYVTTDAVEGPEGTLDVTLPAKQLAWAARLALRLGSDVEILDPPSLVDRVRELARETLAAYAD